VGESALDRDLLCVVDDCRLASNPIETEIFASDVEHCDFDTTTR
jgi:hypothetical protein